MFFLRWSCALWLPFNLETGWNRNAVSFGIHSMRKSDQQHTQFYFHFTYDLSLLWLIVGRYLDSDFVTKSIERALFCCIRKDCEVEDNWDDIWWWKGKQQTVCANEFATLNVRFPRFVLVFGVNQWIRAKISEVDLITDCFYFSIENRFFAWFS